MGWFGRRSVVVVAGVHSIAIAIRVHYNYITLYIVLVDRTVLLGRAEGLTPMLTAVLDMIRQWRWWKHKRRRFTMSAPLNLHVSPDDLWLVEEELAAMEKTTARLLSKLNQQPEDAAIDPEEECIVCVSGARASVSTYPCGHRLLCRKCFLRTIQMAVAERALPLRCVVCRCKIARLKYETCTSRNGPVSMRPRPVWPL